MGIVLELRSPSSVDGISIDPEPNWNFDTLVSEINSLEKKLNASSKFPSPFTKTSFRDVPGARRMERNARGFVMRVSEDELESVKDESDDEDHNQSSIVARRFVCDELYLSDSDDELVPEHELYLMHKMVPFEGALYELTNDHQTKVKEEIRIQVSAVESGIMNEIETSRSAIARVEKYRETRKEVERKLDLQYQRKVAEALDGHLTAIQREHELKSQIEERKIRSDAAQEEAKRRGRAIQEEKLRQEKARAEAEMQAKIRAEEAKKEAERKVAEEAAEQKAAEQKAAEEKAAREKAAEISLAGSSGNLNGKTEGTSGKFVRASESALTLEEQRLKRLKELEDMNQTLTTRSNENFSSFERHISRLMRQISGTKDNVTAKATEIVKIFNDPRCPNSISIAAFAKKVVSFCENPSSPYFACSYVILMVTSKFPQAMDVLLAELHKACIYTVPKHIVYSEMAFASKEAYRKAIGFQETEGKIENVDNYLKRTESYMKLYGALVQTEIPNVRNIHGLEEGWAWLARFLNRVPANRVTATALNAFLQMAGFALHRRYKTQFLKILNVAHEHFLAKLRTKQDSSELGPIVMEITSYLDDKKYLQEPEGRSLLSNLLSRDRAPEPDHHESYYQDQYYGSRHYNNWYHQ
ncbi:PREDICTED: protein GLE1 isoform X2 [Tarenaya hassleriana]|uniref:protein GLE1 isoform X2 n=1 Tax=Tarenaya hassleriana TaxID=28532 RepID=UPI00053C9A95|nr:PREDICTED: protein GLE1 isoform X2 [Tarenaya hassleriana]